jgi:uncharacterized protein (DUF362 family)
MGEVYDEFERELATLNARHAGKPADEMLALWMVSLEREQIVSVAYQSEIIAQRVDALPVPEEVRAVVRHALRWAWRDEEMHAIFVRGLLLRMRRPIVAARALAQQASGAVAGWVGSVRQHVRWRDAPLSRLVATLLAFAGRLLGKVSRTVSARLRYDSFRAFARFNIDAEKTAALAWRRLAEMAASSGAPLETVAEYRRIEDDELRHAQVFEAFVDALDDGDHLAPGVTPEAFAARVAEAGEFFLVRGRRRETVAENPLGAGGVVHVARGAPTDDKRALLAKLLDDAGLGALLEARAAARGVPISELTVAIKPSFMLGYRASDRSVLTDPALVEELAAYLRRQGVGDVAVVEGRNLYDAFFDHRAVAEVARYFGFASPHYRLVDASEEQVEHTFDRGMAQYTVSRTWRDADVRITFGKLRSHPVEQAYLTLANLEGIGARCDEFLFADRKAHRDAALMTTTSASPPHFALLDAHDDAADGLIGVMGCTAPKQPRRLYAGADAIAVDLVAARHLAIADAAHHGLLRTACDWFGDPSAEIRIEGCDEPIADWRGPYHTELSTLLSFFAYPVYELGSGRGSLFVPEMDEAAFPLLRREGFVLRVVRALLRRLIGIHHRRVRR